MDAPPPPGTVVLHLRPVPARLPPAELAAARALLDEEENRRLNRLRRTADRHLFAASHAFLRRVLARHTGRPPQSLRFAAGPHGKPRLPGSEVDFNLSHTAGCVAAAVAAGRGVGVDVEAPGRRLRRQRLARRYFAPAETAALLALPAAEEEERFLRLWTLKESFLKAIGTGLSRPLSDFRFRVGQEGRLGFAPPAGYGPWQFLSARLPGGHLVALAAAGDDDAALRVVPGEAEQPALLGAALTPGLRLAAGGA